MPDQKQKTATPLPADAKHSTPAEEEAQLERVANEAADEAGKTEERFDRNHSLFTK
jgi:hypothetical protein